MLKFGRAVVKARVPIVIIALLLLIPAALGMVRTRINYNMLDYLPKDIDTVKGQNILLDDFGKGGFSLVIVEGMDAKDVASLKAGIEQVDHVASVVWYDSLTDLSVPMQMLPDEVYDAFNKDGATMMAVFFDTSTSADETMEAVSQIRSLAGKQCFVSGLSALVTDLKNLCQEEEPAYVAIAVLCACAAMMLLLDNWITPLLFLAGIGMTILYNMGTNYFLGEISYISKALAAVLQLAVTMDYSIFLWHSYGAQKMLYTDRKEAMAHAIAESVTAISGSCLTTIAGFIAMCFMSYTMGMDLGIVMAKGVLLGVIGCFTILPSLLLIFDRLLDKTGHKPLIPPMGKLAGFVTKRYWIFLLVFAVLLVPALYGYLNAPKSYDFTSTFSSQSIPSEEIPFYTAAEKLYDDFDIATTHMILCSADMSSKDAKAMIGEIDKVDGVLYALGKDSVVGSLVPDDMLPDSLRSELEAGGYQLILINSSYKVSTDECNAQLDAIEKILKRYDPSGMLIGEASCTKDLIRITDHDFTVVTWVSIGMVFLIILLTLRSISLPVILVTVIEFAIFINLGIPYYQDKSMLFLAPICLSTIQLGATVDYAILLTTHYKTNRRGGMEKRGAITEALTVSIPSILVSSCGLFAATIGVSIYSDIGVISDMLTVTVITSMQTTKLKRQKQLEAENELERARANLLRAISHDLRTPLTSIYGACSAVSGNYDALTREQHIKLLSQAQEDAQWLIRMVENLLTVTRMSMDSGVKIKKFPVVLEELVDGVLTKFRSHHPDVPVKVDIPDEFIRIPMDAMLIEQVLINLFENAVQHASGMTKIGLRVRVTGGLAIFVVTDDGCGIRQDIMRHMFTDFVKNKDLAADDKSRSMGIGLSVCATIVRAHGGKITAENIPTGGAMFRFILPAGEDKDEQ